MHKEKHFVGGLVVDEDFSSDSRKVVVKDVFQLPQTCSQQLRSDMPVKSSGPVMTCRRFIEHQSVHRQASLR